MKPFGSARAIVDDVADARADLSRMADDVERVTKAALAVLTIVGIVASIALIVAVTKD